jgi:hypothetical protein
MKRTVSIDQQMGNRHYYQICLSSNTCAVDSANKLVYSIGNKSPYPLMKYSIATDKWTTIKDLGIGGNRLDFNVKILYYSESSTIYH